APLARPGSWGCAGPRPLSVSMPLGRERQLGPARRRDGVRPPTARAAPGDRRVRPPPDRRAPGRLPRRHRGVRGVAEGLAGSDRRLERDYIASGLVLVALRAAAEELDPACNHLDRTAPLAFLLPRSRLEAAVDGDPQSLAEVLGAPLRLPVPGRHGHEVR